MATYYPETIEQTPINGTTEPLSVPSTGYGALQNVTYSSNEANTELPQANVADHTINYSLNTKSMQITGIYSFGKVGALQIGTYVAGVSGQIKISPDGIVGLNSSNQTTFAIDGKTGDATFRGTVAAGSIVAGYVADTGGNYTTSSTGSRVMLLPDANTGIIAYASDGTTVVFKVTVGGTDVGDVQIGNYVGNNGMLWDNSTGLFTIKGNMTAGAISGTTISGNTITGGTISGTTITGGTITGSTFSTGSSGNRVEMQTSQDSIVWYNSSNQSSMQMGLEGSTIGKIYTVQSNRDLVLYSGTGTVKFNNNNLGGLGNISTSGTISAGTFSGTLSGSVSGGSGSFSSVSMSGGINMNSNSLTNVVNVGGSGGTMAFNNSGRIQINTSFDPSSSGSYNFGGSSRYWNYLNCVGITKYSGGSWGYFDNGVEMQDGTILSDTEALLAMEENKDVLTPYGATTYKTSSLPKVVRKKPICDVCGEVLPQDENGKFYKMVKKMIKDNKGKDVEIEEKIIHEEGEDVFATISIMLGAIKELTREVKSLKSQLNI